MIEGGTLTVSVKDCVALVVPLLAMMLKGKVPVELGVPLRVAVPLPLSWKLTPMGRMPIELSVVAAGKS